MPVPPNHVQVGRLAMREEGDKWNAYYMMPGTDVDPIWIGSIALQFVGGRKDRQAAFMDLMREGVGDLIEAHTGVRPVWGGPVPAPEHERTKKG